MAACRVPAALLCLLRITCMASRLSRAISCSSWPGTRAPIILQMHSRNRLCSAATCITASATHQLQQLAPALAQHQRRKVTSSAMRTRRCRPYCRHCRIQLAALLALQDPKGTSRSRRG